MEQVTVGSCHPYHRIMVHQHMIRTFHALILLVLASAAIAQGRFTINGRLKIENGDLNGARVVVYKNGQKERVLTADLSKFSLDLELNENYILSFEKQGSVSKKLSFNTRVPPEAAVRTFTPFDFSVSLFKQYDDLNMVVFNQPVGSIRYEPALSDFDYDMDYTKSIQAKLQEAMEQVERRQKEDAQREAAEAKQRAAEEKALAKKKAEEEKQALAQAKAEEKAKEEVAREEQRKAAEAAQLAQARKKEEQAKQVTASAAASTPKATPEPSKQGTSEGSPKPVIGADKTPASRPAPTIIATGTIAEPVMGEESRRSIQPILASEVRPEEIPEQSRRERNEELIEEPNKLTTIVKIAEGGIITEYRRVFHRWGGTFYFKNGIACSRTIYDQEAFGESLAGATPASGRGKLDR